MKPTKGTVYGYARVSTAELNQADTLERQVANIRGWAEAQKLWLAHVYVDHGISGSVPLNRRPQGGELVKALRPGDTVIITELDRAFRSLLDAVKTLETWTKRGIRFVVISFGGNQLDASSAMGAAFLQMSAVWAEAQRKLISERSSKAARRKQENGLSVGGVAPIGFRKKGGDLIPDESEQEAMAIIRELTAKGWGPGPIATELNRRGIPSRGEEWYRGSVNRIQQRLA